MKKSVIVIIAVAIIGLVGIASKHQDGVPMGGTFKPASLTGSQAAANTAQASGSSSGSSSSSSTYKDGTFTGASEDTPYGTVQIAVVISGGKITNVNFLQMPGPEGHSRELTAYAEPYLKQTTLKNQSANIDFVSGASTTSEAFDLSLQAALNQAA